MIRNGIRSKLRRSKCEKCLGRGYYETFVPPENPGISIGIPRNMTPIKTKYVLCSCGYGTRIYSINWGHKNITTVQKLLELFFLYPDYFQVYFGKDNVYNHIFDRGEVVGTSLNVPLNEFIENLILKSIYSDKQAIFITTYGDFAVMWRREDAVSETEAQLKALSEMPKEKEIEGI